MDSNMFTTPFQLTKGMHRDVYQAVDPKSPDLRVNGKVVLISGAGGGLGYAIAKAWSEAGAKGVVLVGRDSEKLKSTAGDLAGPSIVTAGNIANEADVDDIFKQAIEKFGRVDVVINAAGTMNTGPIGQIEPSKWWQDYEINVKGTFNLARYLISTASGHGTFINIVSLGATLVVPGQSAYGPSQLAATKLGEFVDLEQPNIRMFSIHPGIVEAENGRGAVVDAFTPFAKDKQALTAGFTLWLQKEEADFLRGGFVSVNWDVDEMKEHHKEIVEGKLLKLGFLNAKLGPEGHPWSGTS